MISVNLVLHRGHLLTIRPHATRQEKQKQVCWQVLVPARSLSEISLRHIGQFSSSFLFPCAEAEAEAETRPLRVEEGVEEATAEPRSSKREALNFRNTSSIGDLFFNARSAVASTSLKVVVTFGADMDSFDGGK